MSDTKFFFLIVIIGELFFDEQIRRFFFQVYQLEIKINDQNEFYTFKAGFV